MAYAYITKAAAQDGGLVHSLTPPAVNPGPTPEKHNSQTHKQPQQKRRERTRPKGQALPLPYQEKPWQRPTLPPHNRAVPSAQGDLTTGFGMRPSVTLLPKPPRKPTPTTTTQPNRGATATSKLREQSVREHPIICSGQALDLLVPVSSTPHEASTPGLSTLSSTGSLTLSRRQETSSRSKLPA